MRPIDLIETECMPFEPSDLDRLLPPDLRCAALRVLSIRGAVSAEQLGEALQAVKISEPELVLEALVERGDAWGWPTPHGRMYAAMPHRRARLAGQTLEIGAASPTGPFDCASEDPVELLTHLLGLPDWLAMAEGRALTLEAFARIAEGSEALAWRTVAERGVEACRLGRVPANAPRQLRALRHLAEDLDGAATAALNAALPVWAGFKAWDQTSDPGQEDIIERSAAERIVVVAGPGAGKTQTTRARLEALIGRGVPAPGIVVISYSRGAVAELRARLRRIEDVRSLDITTLDSLAGRLVTAADEGYVFESYDNTIRAAAMLLGEGNRIAEAWLGERRHVVIDEAQDVLGIRRELMLAIIANLPPDCGVTVLCDPAQAIHEYDERRAGRGVPVAIDNLLKEKANFERRELSRNYRTANPSLLALADEGRAILARAASGERALELMRGLLREKSEGPPPPPHGALPPPELSLFRWRAEAAWHTVRMLAEGVPVSLDGLVSKAEVPALAPAWVGRAMELLDGRGRDALPETAVSLSEDPLAPGESELRDALVGAIHQGRFKAVLMARMMMNGNAPPVPEPPGLMRVSTIHAAKGGEADNVAVYLPNERNKFGFDTDPIEEARVLYVAGTRARRRLYVSGATGAMERQGGRYWRRRNGAVQVLITRADAAGMSLLPGADPGLHRRPVLRWSRETGLWVLHVENAAGEEVAIAELSEGFAKDVSSICRHAMEGARFLPVARGTLRCEPLTVADDETLRVVPVLEGFVWINLARK